MSSEILKVALIGAGRISQRHFSAINDPSNRTQLVAVCDIDEGRAKEAALQTAVSAYTSVPEMLRKHPGIGLISICTPSGTHFELAMELLDCGIPLLIEKPLTLSTQQAKQLVELSKTRNLPVFVVKQNRLNPPILETRKKLNSGTLGRLLSASANVTWCRPAEYYLQDPWRLTRELDGGVVWNQASHYVDLLVHLLDPVVSVAAVGANFLSPSAAEDTVHAVLQTESGQIASLVATTTARPKNFEGSMTLITEKGVVKVGGHALNELVSDTTQSETRKVAQEGSGVDVDSVYGSGHHGVYAQVVADLLEGTVSEFRIENGIATVALIEAIHLSISESRMVLLNEFLDQGN